MDTSFYIKLVKLCMKAYSTRKDLGTAEYLLERFTHKGVLWQGLIIPGTDELEDWNKNLNLNSISGLKESSLEEALTIRFDSYDLIDHSLPLVVAGHSKGAATALVYHKVFRSDYCVSFCPARCFKDFEKIDKCTLFIDPDDPVTKLGSSVFKLPNCEVITLPNDHFGVRVEDHYLENVLGYLETL